MYLHLYLHQEKEPRYKSTQFKKSDRLFPNCLPLKYRFNFSIHFGYLKLSHRLISKLFEVLAALLSLRNYGKLINLILMKKQLKIFVIIAVIAFFVVLKYFNCTSPVVIFFFSFLVIVTFICVIIPAIFQVKYRYGIRDIFIGDEGGYSLSRLQAVLWAIVIISYQLSVIVALLMNKNFKNPLQFYQITFSEETLWLLGLSLGSYISVKGITIDQINKNPSRLKSKRPKFSDIIVGDNGLDFSRIQMLIWTIIAVFIFISNVELYLSKIVDTKKQEDLIGLFYNHIDQFTQDQPSTAKPDNPPLPYLPWSFIVLMGLSQGAYVGKKLIPTFKLDDLKQHKEKELDGLLKNYEYKKVLLEKIKSRGQTNSITDADKENIQKMEEEIKKTQDKIEGVRNEIALANEYKR